MTSMAHGFYISCSAGAERPRIWSGDEPDQQTGPDPAGKEGEGAGVHASHRARPPSPQGVRDAGESVRVTRSPSLAHRISEPEQMSGRCRLKARSSVSAQRAAPATSITDSGTVWLAVI